jgi:ubiquinol-cytochrome c reductase subunit 6
LLYPFSVTLQAEVVDKLPEIRAECLLACPKQEDLYQACVKRITEKKEGDCESWFMEFLHCQDKCVAPKIFAATKE